MQEDLTERQREVLVAISKYIREHGYAPTMSEIADVFGWSSKNAAHYYVNVLERKGYITRSSHQARTIKVVP